MRFASRRRPSRRKLFVEALENRRVMATLQLAFYNDANINNAREASENLLAGPIVNFFVDLDASGTLTPGDITGSTNTGVATLVSPILGAGAFNVFANTAGTDFASSGPQIASVLDPLAVVTVPDIGLYRLGEIDGYAFVDSNGNGIDNAESRVTSGVTVSLLGSGPDNIFGNADDLPTATTTPDAVTGQYSFNRLDVGSYQVTVNTPTGVVLSTLAPGVITINQGGSVFAPTTTFVTPDTFQSIPVATPSLAIGLFRTGEIRGQKFNDHNADGTRQSTDEGLSGVSFTLTGFGTDNTFGTADDFVLNSTTNASGDFSFTNLAVGTYRLAEVANPNLQTTTAAFVDFVVNASGLMFVPNATTGTPDFYQSRTTRPELLRGNFRFGEIYGYAFVDANGNGTDNAESRVTSGVSVTLRGAGPDNAFNTADDLPTVSTNPDPVTGAYNFRGLSFGRYLVGLATPAGVVRTTPAFSVVTINDSGRIVAPTDTFVTPDARQTTPVPSTPLAIGLFRNAEIRGHKFNDHNADGIKQTIDEGLAGVTFTLTGLGADNTLGTADDITLTTVSNAAGDFSFTNLALGTYRLAEATNVNIKTTTAAFTDFVVNASGQLFVPNTATGTPDAYQTRVLRPELRRGNFRLGEIYGYVFVDRNSNGADNAETRNMPGVTMLLTYAGPDNNFATTADNTTQVLTPNATTGIFSATQLDFGRYQLQEQLPTGVIRTTLAQSVFTINDSGLIFAANNTLATPDARQLPVTVRTELAVGVFRLGEIYGYTFVDTNDNGIDNAEPRATPGVTLLLTWAGPDNDFATVGDNQTTTLTPNATTGLYSARSLVAGQYRLQEQLPANVVRTTAALGTYIINDSGLIFSATAALVTPDPRQLPATLRPELALGVFRLGVIRGYAFGDTNGDGVDSGAERRGDDVLAVPPEASELRVTVQLFRNGVAVPGTVTTDAAGLYTFAGLRQGDYRVDVISITPDRKLTTVRSTTVMTVNSGSVFQAVPNMVTPLDAYQTAQTNVGLAVGSAKLAVIKGIVYLDRDGNGVQGNPAQEPGMAGFTISLVSGGLDGRVGGANAADDVVIDSFITTSTGLYEFIVGARLPVNSDTPDILPGEYSVTITEPLHYRRGNGTNNGTETRVITNVRLNDVILGTALTPTVTPLNADQTTKTDANLSFGVQRYAAIQGIAFNDLNANTIRDAGESVLAGQTIRLQGPVGFTTRQVVTNASGVYLFDDLPAGNYTVSPVLDTVTVNGVVQETQGRTKNYAQVNASLNTVYAAPGLDLRAAFEKANSSTPPVERIVLSPSATLEQGIVQLSKIEGTVFLDTNLNSVQDAGEAGQSGVDVAIRRLSDAYLQDEYAAERILKTDATGKYTFYVWPGNYDIAEVTPAGFEATSPRKRFSEYGLVNVEGGKFAKPRWSFAASLDTIGTNNDLVVVDEFFDRAAQSTDPQFKVGGVRIYLNVGTAQQKVQEIAFAANARPSYAVATNLNGDNIPEIVVTTSGTPVGVTSPSSLATGDVLILSLEGGQYVVYDPLNGEKVTNPSTVGNRVKDVTTTIGGDGPRHVSVAEIGGSVYLAIANERNYDDPSNTAVVNYHDVSIAKQDATKPFLFTKTRTIDVSTPSVTAEVITTAFGKFDGTNFSLAVPQTNLGRVDFFNPVTGAKVLTSLTGLQRPTHLLVGNFVQLPADNNVAYDDLVVTENSGNRVALYPQVNRQLGTKMVVGSIARPTFAAAADVDQDGDLDLAVTSGGSGTVTVFFNQVPGLPSGTAKKFLSVSPALDVKTLTAVQGTPGITTASIVQPAFGDFNGDSFPDMIATPFSGGVSILPGTVTTAGNWQSLQTIKPATKGVALTDKRPATEATVPSTSKVLPIRNVASLAVAYPTAANSAVLAVPSNLAVGPVATINAAAVGNTRTAPAPLKLANSLRANELAFDVTGNGQIEPMDALLVINSLNSSSLPDIGALDVNGDGIVTPLDALLVINSINSQSIVGETIDIEAAQSMFDAAVARLTSASSAPQLLAPLVNVKVVIDDLPEGVLSWVTGDTLVVDRRASGRGWFVDSTPEDDAEFANGRSVAGVDLLSVLTHEIGHLLGLEDQLAGGEDEIMHAELHAGERRLDADAVDRLIGLL